jgi:hypothetical protein
VLANEARCAVIVDDELQRLVEPAVAAVAVPVLACALFQCDRGRIVEADDEGGGFDGFDCAGVDFGGSFELGIHVSPDIAVLRRKEADRSRLLGVFVNAVELELELGGVELLAVDLVRHFPELVLPYDDNMRVLFGRVLDGRIYRLLGYTAEVEHVLIRAHGHGQLLHVLGLQRLVVYGLLKLQHGSRDCRSTLGRIPSFLVIAVRVEVAHIGHNRVSVAHVRCLIPPLCDPISSLWLVSVRNQSLLQCLARPAWSHKILDGLGGGLELGFCQQRMHGFEVPLGCFFEGRHGESGQRVFEAQHCAFGRVLFVACSGLNISFGGSRGVAQQVKDATNQPAEMTSAVLNWREAWL